MLHPPSYGGGSSVVAEHPKYNSPPATTWHMVKVNAMYQATRTTHYFVAPLYWPNPFAFFWFVVLHVLPLGKYSPGLRDLIVELLSYFPVSSGKFETEVLQMLSASHNVFNALLYSVFDYFLGLKNMFILFWDQVK